MKNCREHFRIQIYLEMFRVTTKGGERESSRRIRCGRLKEKGDKAMHKLASGQLVRQGLSGLVLWLVLEWGARVTCVTRV